MGTIVTTLTHNSRRSTSEPRVCPRARSDITAEHLCRAVRSLGGRAARLRVHRHLLICCRGRNWETHFPFSRRSMLPLLEVVLSCSAKRQRNSSGGPTTELAHQET